jgi:DNA-binding MarR family transcriptional regulator
MAQQGPPLIGALLRMPWEVVRERMLTGLHEAGFSDLITAHLNVLQYPGPESHRPSDLAAQSRMSKQAINYLLGQMEQLGYLTRVGDGHDQRAKRIHLTERGHASVQTIRATVRQVESEWEQQLGHERFALLRELLIELGPVARRAKSAPAGH